MVNLIWTELKALYDNIGGRIVYIESTTHYRIYLENFVCSIDKIDIVTTDKDDFENNYKDKSNLSIGSTLSTSNAPEILTNTSDVTLPKFADGYGDIFSYTGDGIFYQYSMKLKSHEIYTALEIDGVVVSELFIKPIHDMADTDADDVIEMGMIKYSKKKRVIIFVPLNPIQFFTSIKVVGKAKDTHTDRKIEDSIVILEKF